MKITPLLPVHLLARRACLRAALWLVTALAIIAGPASAALTEAWVRRYTNPVNNADDQAFKVVRDAAGDFIVTGTTEQDMLTIKYSGADGALLWEKRYNGPANANDTPSSLALGPNGMVAVTGSSSVRRTRLANPSSPDGPPSQVSNGPALHRPRLPISNNQPNPAERMKTQIHSLAAPGPMASVVSNFLTRRICFWTALELLATLASGPSRVHAAVTEAWVHRYSNVVSNSIDQARKVVSDAAGDIVVTGFTNDGITGSDMLTIKYSGVDGTVLWQRRYNGPANGDDSASAMTVDAGGNVVVTGSSSNGSNSDYYTAKYAATDGAVVWEKRYNGPANGDDRANAVAVDGGVNVVVTGSSGGDYYTAKYAAADGTLLWETRYNGPAHKDYPNAVSVDGSGNVVVTGASHNTNGDFNTDYYTAKYASADGALLWEKRYNGPANSADEARALAVDGSGNVLVTGTSRNGAPQYDYDSYTAKYSASDGALLWERRGPIGDATSVAVDGSGNGVVTGTSSGGGVGPDYYTAKYAAADGALLWEKRYNGPANSSDGARALAVDGSGNVVVTGSSKNADSYDDFYTAKYAAANGALLWEMRYNGPANREDYPAAVAVDGSGNVVVTGGASVDKGGGQAFYTAKYAAATGALLWEKRYNGPTKNRSDFARAVAVDGSGNVVVTGSSTGDESNSGNYPATDTDYYTAKYAAANGALLWEVRYNGPANSADDARALAVDASGNVVVTGVSRNGTRRDDYDYYTAKYAAADGALLWEHRYNGPENPALGNVRRPDYARAVALDSKGNVVVTGDSGYWSLLGMSLRFYTAKYASADGALLWERRSDVGGEDGPDGARAVAVDGSGNVVVTGYLRDGCYTAKYGASDGALLWEQRSPSCRTASIAVDGSGNVMVTGFSYSGIEANGNLINPDYYTAKYAVADGALLWEKRYHGQTSAHDYAWAVASDGSDNAIVTGVSGGHYYTIKYAAADGALLWEKRGPIGGATSVAVDGSGNAVVTGSSRNGTNYDYYTAKYAAADGALLWERRYNGPANGDDFMGGPGNHGPGPDDFFVGSSQWLAIGPNGMIAITGSSDGNFGSGAAYDFATVVYRELPAPVSFADWASGFGLTGAVAAANADPDSDRMANAVEDVLGGNPMMPTTSERPTVTASGGDMVFSFSRDDESETPDVTLAVETGTDLLTWPTVFAIGPNTAASSPGVSVTENGAAADSITVTIAQGADTHLFARLKVTIAP